MARPRRDASVLLLLVAVAIAAFLAWKLDFRGGPHAAASAPDAAARSADDAAPAFFGAPAPFAAPLAGAAPSASPSAAAPAPAPAPDVPAASALGAGRIYGTVRARDGRPIAGALVQAFAGAPEGGMKKGAAVMIQIKKKKAGAPAAAEARTGPDGGYALERLAPGDFSVLVDDESHQSANERATLAPGAAVRLDFLLDDGVSVSGRVRDPRGAPLAGIEVASVFPERRTTTGPDGSFALHGLGGMAMGPLRAHDSSGRYGDVEQFAAPGDAAVEVVMRPAAQLSGRVVERRSGAPIEGASVGAASPMGMGGMEHLSKTDADGRFEIAGLAPGAYRLRASKDGYAAARADAEVAEGEHAEVAIELGAGAAIVGRVTDGQGAGGLAGASVFDVTDLGSAGPFGPEGFAEMLVAKGAQGTKMLGGMNLSVAQTADDGSYRLDRVPAGRRKLVALDPVHEALAREVDVPEEGGEARADFALGGGATVAGHVLHDGAPVAGAGIMAFSPTTGGRSAETGPDGAYAIRGLRPGVYMVMLQPNDDAPTAQREMRSVTLERGGTAVVDFGVAASGALVYGVVTGGTVGGPIDIDVDVTLLRAGQGLAGMREAKVQADGTYRIEGVEAGIYDVAVRPTFHARFVVAPDTPEVRLDIALPALALAGTVRREDGAPIAGAQVSATRTTDRESPLFRFFRASGASDADGAFTLEGLDGADYDVEVAAPGFARATRTVSLAGGAPPPLDVRLAPGGVIHARVFAPDGTAVTDALLMAEDAAGHTFGLGPKMMITTGQEVKLEGLPAGVYTVTALSMSWAFDRRTGVAFDGTDLTLDFGLSPGGALAVACRDESGAPVAGAALDLRYPDGTPLPASPFDVMFAPVSGPDGVARRQRLPAGAYRGTARTADGREAAFDATIANGGTTSVVVTLGAALR
jgi:hypothetical protein